MDNEGLAPSELTLRDYVALLRRNALLIAAIAAVCVVVAAIYSTLATPRFESTAQVLLRTTQNQRLFPAVGDSQQRDFIREPAAEFEFAQSTLFSQQASSQAIDGATVDVDFDSAATSSLTRSALLDFTGTSSDPDAAQQAAQSWAQTYLEVREQSEMVQVQVAIESLTAQIEALEVERDEILAPLRPLDEALLTETDAASISLLTTQRVALQQSLDDELLPVRSQLRTLSTDLAGLRIVSSFLEQPEISARLSVDAPPARKVAPNAVRNMGLGVVLGLMLGIGAALLRDSLQVTLETRAEIEAVAGAGSVLATLPVLDPERDSSKSIYDAELERVVGAVVFQIDKQNGTDYRLLVTSPNPSDGKSTLSFELASRLSRGGINTALIDGDLRKPTLHTHMQIGVTAPGLVDLLDDGNDGQVRAVRTPRHPGLVFVPAGEPTANAAALLMSGFGNVVNQVARRRTESDDRVIVVDSPPLLAVTDAEVMAKEVHGVVLVTRSGTVTRSQLQLCLRRIDDAGTPLLGIVLVGIGGRESGYGYGYGYGYGPDVDAEPQRPKRSWLRAVGS